MENPNLDQIERETSALLGTPTPMHSRKKLQKKETPAPIPKKYLEHEVSGGLCAALGEERCFYVNYSGVVKESLAKIKKGLSKKKKKKEKCLKIGLNPGSTHPPCSQLSYPPWWGP